VAAVEARAVFERLVAHLAAVAQAGLYVSTSNYAGATPIALLVAAPSS
jgi:hypothetical protein